MGTLILFYNFFLFFTPISVLLWTVINDAELFGVSVVNMTVLNFSTRSPINGYFYYLNVKLHNGLEAI